MAQRTVLIDDMNPDQSADHTVSFALNGKNYEIDLNEENVQKLEQALEPFIAVARPARTTVTRKPAKAGSKASAERTAAIREWGRENGYEVSDRGRLHRDLVEAYEAAQG